MDKIKQFLSNISGLLPVQSGSWIDARRQQAKADAELEQQMRLAEELRLREETERMAYQKYGSTYRPDWGANNNMSIEEIIRQNQDILNGGGGYGGGGAPLSDPNSWLQSQFDQVKNALKPAMDEWGKADARAKEFDEKNPYAFDEKQARASAEERFNPYYNAELGDYLTGVERTRSRGVEDDRRLQQEISADTEQYVGRSRRELDKAIESSGEGYAGAGLFFGGQRVRREGEMKVDTAENIADYNTEQNRRLESSSTGLNRLFQDTEAQSRTYQRRLGAEKETNILTDIAKQQGEYARNRELQRQQYIGFPYATGTSSIKSLLGV